MIYFCTGVPMAGKTNKLITDHEKASQRGLKCLVLQPLKASSSNRPKVMSRNGKNIDCLFIENVPFDSLNQYDTIFIDEVQYLPVSMVEKLSHLDVDLYLYGLDNINGIPIAEHIKKVATTIDILPYECDRCHNANATIAHWIGGKEEWECICDKCFYK